MRIHSKTYQGIKDEVKQSEGSYVYIKPVVEVEYHFSTWFGVLIFFCNFFIPGFGTLLMWSFLKNHSLRNQMLCNAFCQFITWPLVVGWIMAQIYSCAILGISEYKPIVSEDIECIEQMKNKKMDVNTI